MIRIGIVGTGGMARAHANAFAKIRGCRVTACCDIDPARAEAFAGQHGVARVFPDYAALLADGEIDAISTPTPDAVHAEISLAAIRAGKHILCEKPLATSYEDAKRMAAAARRAGVIHMVNLSYRDAPAVQKAAALLRSGRLGPVRHVEARYLQGWLVGKHWGDWRTSPAWLWRLSSAHGSLGVLGDIGVHIVDLATFPVGPVRRVQCLLSTLRKAPRNRVGAYRLDANDTASIAAEFPGGVVANISMSRWATGRVNSVSASFHCENGAVAVDLDRSRDTILVCRGADLHRAQWKEVACPPAPNIYRRFIRGIQSGRQDEPDFHRGAEVQRVLDACFRSSADGGVLLPVAEVSGKK